MQFVIVCVLLLSCGMVSADLESETYLNLTVTSHLRSSSETIEINYRRKFVKLSTPLHDGVTPVELFHDYNQGHNIMKKNGQCFILNDFDGVPEDIKSWARLQGDAAASVESGDNLRIYSYRVLPYVIARSPLPATVQEFCPGSIRILVLDVVLDDEEAMEMDQARVEMTENPELRGTPSDGEEAEEGEDEYGEIFIPASVLHSSRVKRGWWRRAWNWGREHITGGRRDGGYWVGVRWRWTF